MKAQPIRVLDVYLIGPAMIYAATIHRAPPWLRAVLLVSGVATVLYNASNYLTVEGKRDARMA